MASGRDLLESEEKKSYGAVFLLSVALLLACTVWALWQDSFSRHLWKKYKADFYRLAISTYEGQEEAERARLSEVPEYVSLSTELTEAKKSLDSGEAARKTKELEAELDKAEIKVGETDLDLRIVKGEIEEGWYLLEFATHNGESGAPEHQHLEDLLAAKEVKQKAYDDAVAHRDEVLKEMDVVRSREIEIEDQLQPYVKDLDAIDLKLDSVSVNLFGHRFPRVPMLEQVVLHDYEKNNFDQWVSRVERCQNCHVAIDRAGFENEENPLKTHPDRAYYLGNHEFRAFGCTPCHGGQGASVNSVEQAHGLVHYWEDPLLNIHDKVQAKCLVCHVSAQGMKGAEIVAHGEELFRDLGCHGCHLMRGLENLPKAGPSLKRIAAKAPPEWIVSWIQEPKAFRPRTRMPHFFLTRDESTAVAAYLLSSSLDDSSAWLDLHPSSSSVDSTDQALVAEGKQLTETLGCLGCHGFEPDQYASQVAVGKDVAPNLSRIAEKTNGRWIYNWISNPREYSETARMPRLRLSSREATAITSYLLTLKQSEPPAPDPALRSKLADPAVIADGARLIRRYGCFGCHTINGMEKESRVSVELSGFSEKHVDELFFGDRLDVAHTWDDWTLHKILTPRTYATERIEQNMPEFGFDESDARALVVYLASRSTKLINHKYQRWESDREAKLKHGREVIAYYNCQGCHSFDGRDGAIRKYYEDNIEMAPPILEGEGTKLQPEWFFDFLKRPLRLRPWLNVRMPTFGLDDTETTAIVEYFGALQGYDLGPVVLESREEAHTAAVVHGKPPEEYFDCSACHMLGGGRVPDDRYSVSRKSLSDAEIAAWLEENLGIESAGAGDETERVERLRQYLDKTAN